MLLALTPGYLSRFGHQGLRPLAFSMTCLDCLTESALAGLRSRKRGRVLMIRSRLANFGVDVTDSEESLCLSSLCRIRRTPSLVMPPPLQRPVSHFCYVSF